MNNYFWAPPISMKFFNNGQGVFSFYKYLLTKHKKPNISTTVHLTRKKFIYSGRYLKGGHFEKKWTGRWAIQNAEGGVSKTNYVKLNLQTPNFSQSII